MDNVSVLKNFHGLRRKNIAEKTRKLPGNRVELSAREKSHVPETIVSLLVGQTALTTVETQKAFFPASEKGSMRFYILSVFILENNYYRNSDRSLLLNKIYRCQLVLK